MVISELNGQPVKFLAEEMLDIIGHKWEDYDDRLRMMNADPELLPIANHYLSQLTLFTIKTGFMDIKPNNAGLLIVRAHKVEVNRERARARARARILQYVVI